jgi:hypothetical protein
MSGTGLCAQRGGILRRAAPAAQPLFQLRAWVYARWIAPACTRIRHSPLLLPPLHSSHRKLPRSCASRAPCCTRRHGVLCLLHPHPLFAHDRARRRWRARRAALLTSPMHSGWRTASSISMRRMSMMTTTVAFAAEGDPPVYVFFCHATRGVVTESVCVHHSFGRSSADAAAQYTAVEQVLGK